MKRSSRYVPWCATCTIRTQLRSHRRLLWQLRGTGEEEAGGRGRRKGAGGPGRGQDGENRVGGRQSGSSGKGARGASRERAMMQQVTGAVPIRCSLHMWLIFDS